MKRVLAIARLIVGLAVSTVPANAEMSVEAARASIAPFYKALNVSSQATAQS